MSETRTDVPANATATTEKKVSYAIVECKNKIQEQENNQIGVAK